MDITNLPLRVVEGRRLPKGWSHRRRLGRRLDRTGFCRTPRQVGRDRCCFPKPLAPLGPRRVNDAVLRIRFFPRLPLVVGRERDGVLVVPVP